MQAKTNLAIMVLVIAAMGGCATPTPVGPSAVGLADVAPVGSGIESSTQSGASQPGSVDQAIASGGGNLVHSTSFESVSIAATSPYPSSSPSSSPSPSPCPSASASGAACSGSLYGENPANPPIDPLVSFARYQQVTDGMSYERVVQIFGRSGENTFWFRIEDQSSARYRWRNADGSYAEIWFTNDQVASKTNVNLR
jgi:hypothetical protein